MTLSRRQFTLAAGAAATTLAFGAVRAQTGPAGKTVRILVGFPPGQATDAVARMLAEQLTTALGQTVIVENRPGQGGSVVLGQLARSANDGTFMTLSALAAYTVNPHLYKNVQYDTLKDFDPIATVADLPMAMVVNPSLPVKTVAELVAYAKANPTQLSHPSSGNGTLSHLLMEDFKRRAGITIQHVPYQGSPKAMTDLAGGQVQVGLDTLAVTQPLVDGGRLRMLAVGTRERLSWLPNVPTLAELGFAGFEAVAWVALSAPQGTPLAWRQRVNEAVQKSLASPEFQQKLRGLSAIPRPGSIDDFGALLRSEHARWGKVVRDSNVKVD
jgi:tripartite-type tricarboxylate transporter receptor subunit TctC